jgi:hypothetical protein
VQHTHIGIQSVHFDVCHHAVPEQGIAEAAYRIEASRWRPAVADQKWIIITSPIHGLCGFQSLVKPRACDRFL